MSNLAAFRHQYSAELLPRADAATAPGALYNWVGLLHRRLDPIGLNIVYELFDQPTAKELEAQLLSGPLVATSFPQLDLTSDIKAAADVKLPNVLDALKLSLDINKISSFTFETVVSRSLPPAIRLQIRAMIQQLRTTNNKKYRQRIREFWIAENLFYAQKVVIKLQANTQLSAEVEAAIANAPNGKLSGSENTERTISYDQPDCPFAAELIRGRLL